MATSTRRDRTEDEVRALEAAYDDAWLRQDLEAVVRCFRPDATILTPTGARLAGRDQIRLALEALWRRDAPASTHASRIEGIHFVTPAVALIDGTARIDSTEDPARPPIVHAFTDLLVFKEGRWWIAHVRAHRPQAP